MKLLIDEMYPSGIAEQLRVRGHDVSTIHDPDQRELQGAPDEHIFAAALEQGRAIATENVADFRRLERDALAHGLATPLIVYITNRAFPRGRPETLGRLVRALDALLSGPDPVVSTFLRPVG